MANIAMAAGSTAASPARGLQPSPPDAFCPAWPGVGVGATEGAAWPEGAAGATGAPEKRAIVGIETGVGSTVGVAMSTG